jgi:hypothetical protein
MDCEDLANGFFCAGGLKIPCSDFTCAQGSIIPSFGSYFNADNTLVPCEAGAYCEDGERFTCDAGKYSDVPSAGSCFFCPPGTHTQDEGNVECERCPFQGVDCLRSDGKPYVEPGFWRFDDSLPILQSTEFYACPACVTSNETNSNSFFADDFTTKFECREGHDKTVPICGSCLANYWKKGDACVSCGLSSGTPATDILWISLAGVIIVLGGVGYLLRKTLQNYGTAAGNQFRHHKVPIARMIVLYQILKSISDVYRLDESGGYPVSYTTYIQNPFFALLSLDLFGSWSCAGFDFYDELLLTTLLPTVILCICLSRNHVRLPFVGNETVESIGYMVATVSLVPISTVVFEVR